LLATIDQIKVEKVKSGREAFKALSVVSFNNEQVMEETNPIHAIEIMSVAVATEQKNLTAQQPIHVQVPLNIFKANENECSENDDDELETLPTKIETSSHIAKQEKVIDEVANQVVKASQVTNFSLASIVSDEMPIMCNAIELLSTTTDVVQKLNEHEEEDIQQQLQLPNKTNHAKMLLNLANENELTPTTTTTASTIINTDDIQVAMQTISQESPELLLNKVEKRDAVTKLNTATSNQTSFVEEQLSEHLEISMSTDEININTHCSTPRVQRAATGAGIEPLVKPAIAKKPLILNKATQRKSSLTIEQAAHISDATGSPLLDAQPQCVLVRQVSVNVKEQTTKLTKTTPMHMALTNVTNDDFSHEVNDVDENQTTLPIKKLNISEEFEFDNLTKNTQITCQKQSLLALVVEQNVDTLIDESVKPMDTVELNFEEHIQLTRTECVPALNHKENISINTTLKFNRAAQHLVASCNELCDDEYKNENQQTTTMCVNVKLEENFNQHENALNKFSPVELALGKLILIYLFFFN
jgi:hypothetical protein